jgi:hypothetical protein
MKRTYVRALFARQREALIHARETIGIQAVFRYWSMLYGYLYGSATVHMTTTTRTSEAYRRSACYANQKNPEYDR